MSHLEISTSVRVKCVLLQMVVMCVSFDFKMKFHTGYWVALPIEVFRGRARDPCEVWSLVKFHMSCWALVSKHFWNYSLGEIFNWILLGVFGALVSWYALVSFHLFSMKLFS